jgi:hypothetical protein
MFLHPQRNRLLFILLIFVPCSAQQLSNTGKALASGTCAVAHSGNSDVITINCGIGEKQGREIVTLLNKIISNQLDTEVVMKKLDEISAQRPSYGNLSARASDLAEEILGEGKLAGAGMSTKPEDIENRARAHYMLFRFRFFGKVIDIRNDFAQILLKDDQLDELIEDERVLEKENNPKFFFLPAQIQVVAERLKFLANEAKQRDAPRLLSFSQAQVEPQPPKFNFDTVVTITSDTVLFRGYVIVEFERGFKAAGTDVNSVLAFDSDNRPVKDYLASRHPSEEIPIYPMKLKTVVGINEPMHVFVLSGDTPVKVTRVTWFDE